MTLGLGLRLFATAALAAAMLAGCADGLGPDDLPSSDDDESNQLAAGGAPHSETTTTTGATTTTSTAASTSSSTVSSTAASTGSGSGCDNSGDCYNCANCSLGSTCMGAMNACMNDPDCTAFLDCLDTCVDDICANACADAHPNGVNGYMAMTMCAFCTACPSDCAVEGQGLCTP